VNQRHSSQVPEASCFPIDEPQSAWLWWLSCFLSAQQLIGNQEVTKFIKEMYLNKVLHVSLSNACSLCRWKIHVDKYNFSKPSAFAFIEALLDPQPGSLDFPLLHHPPDQMGV
jgi:hypothetical protein